MRAGGRLVQVEPVISGQARGQHRGRDVPAGRAAHGGLEGSLVGRVLNRPAAVHVIQRLHPSVDIEERQTPGRDVIGVVLQRGVVQDLRLRRGLGSGTGHVDLGEVMDQVLIDGAGVDVQVDHHRRGELLAVRVGSRVPVRVPDQRELLAELVIPEHVRPGGDRVQLVPGAGVTGRGHRHGLRHGRHIVKIGERLAQAEHDRGRIRGLHRRQAQPAGRGVPVRPRIARIGQQLLEVIRAAGQHTPGIATFDGVLHVLAGDDAAIFEPDTGPEMIRPRQAMVADPAQAGSQVRHELDPGHPRHRPVSHQRPAVQPDKVRHGPVISVAGIGRIRGTAVIDDDRAAPMSRGIDHRAESSAVSRRGTPGARPTARTGRQGGHRRHGNQCS